jgi:UDP-glucuronate 4-epimerase
MKVLLTGIAGFIGFHVAKKLLTKDISTEIVGIDNMNAYYDRDLKLARLAELGFRGTGLQPLQRLKSDISCRMSFIQMDLQNAAGLSELFEKHRFDYVINMAAQAGVRCSVTNPQTYIDSNVTGFMNILECCRHFPVKHLIYASSSSIYGLNTQMPFSEVDRTDNPASLYAATKKMNESMAHVYAHLFGVKNSGLRLFTVYGEWGRPDMALFLFTERILAGKPIQLFNNGDMKRDFTYVEDIVNGVVELMRYPPSIVPPCEIYNIGNHSPVALADFVRILEKSLGKKALIEYLPMQLGDVPATFADVEKLRQSTGFVPRTALEEGINCFVSWYKRYYNV